MLVLLYTFHMGSPEAVTLILISTSSVIGLCLMAFRKEARGGEFDFVVLQMSEV